MQINMHEAKSQLSALAERVNRGEKVVIAKAGEPWVELIPYRQPSRRTPGRYKGQILMAADFDKTPEDVVAAFEGE
ncbi:type II toxin-antitoxin system prevent-host-death family antitoxin [Pistricoccus aurantiacus]|uniref:Antitoxin n=1 Tax=Pistricoccus aurantiacus TaxID=1883414 RepID=A0A5B8SUP6_9GAMM|nr:type II toxin-antitoxin system prevent-host-death family antitoxin [Pistricoccus aurantiacus]QEA39245.1 type II toxin-antitoxin system prevent-host-death family antitoxin [Pistricoccus aurantiacus]